MVRVKRDMSLEPYLNRAINGFMATAVLISITIMPQCSHVHPILALRLVSVSYSGANFDSRFKSIAPNNEVVRTDQNSRALLLHRFLMV
jgi:hypothetical protein